MYRFPVYYDQAVGLRVLELERFGYTEEQIDDIEKEADEVIRSFYHSDSLEDMDGDVIATVIIPGPDLVGRIGDLYVRFGNDKTFNG